MTAAAAYFGLGQVGGRVELRRISVQRHLHLISLSNYVFVQEISQISGIAQNVSALIKVVMRIVTVVGRRGRRGRRTGEGRVVVGSQEYTLSSSSSVQKPLLSRARPMPDVQYVCPMLRTVLDQRLL